MADQEENIRVAATKKLPERTQRGVRAIHGFVHAAHELVKDAKRPTHERRAAVESYRRSTIAAIRDPSSAENHTIKAFAETVREHGIPELEVHAFLDSVASDTYKKRYRDMHELTQYLRGNATAIGLMITQVLGTTGEREVVKRHTVALAQALAMTRILISVSTDHKTIGCIYLPQDSMHKHGATETMIEKRQTTPELRKTIAELTRWAKREYHTGAEGLHHLKHDARFGVLVSAALSLRMLEKLENEGYDPFSKKIGLGTIERAHIIAAVSWRYKVRKKALPACIGL